MFVLKENSIDLKSGLSSGNRNVVLKFGLFDFTTNNRSIDFIKSRFLKNRKSDLLSKKLINRIYYK